MQHEWNSNCCLIVDTPTFFFGEGEGARAQSSSLPTPQHSGCHTSDMCHSPNVPIDCSLCWTWPDIIRLKLMRLSVMLEDVLTSTSLLDLGLGGVNNRHLKQQTFQNRRRQTNTAVRKQRMTECCKVQNTAVKKHWTTRMDERCRRRLLKPFSNYKIFLLKVI